MAQDEPYEPSRAGANPGRQPSDRQAGPATTLTDSQRPSQGRPSRRATPSEPTDNARRTRRPPPGRSGLSRSLRLLSSPTVAGALAVLAVLVAILALVLDVLDSPTVDRWQGRPSARTTQAAMATSTSQSRAGSTGPTVTSHGTQPSQTELVEDGTLLANGGTNVNRYFRANSPWHLVATGTTPGQLCEVSILDSSDNQIQWSKGETFQVHKRQSGTFKLHQAHRCRVEFHRGVGSPRQLPFTVKPTAGGGATPVFRSTTGFVATSASPDCRAVVFRSSDGRQVGKVIADDQVPFSDAGEFWIETQQRNCSLTVRSA